MTQLLERFTVSQAQPEDVTKFTEILMMDQIIWEQIRGMITEANAHYFQDPDTLIWFAHFGQQPIGMLWLILNSDRKDMSNGKDLAELHQFRVVSSFRGQRVGSLLYQTAENEARKRSFKTLTLAVEKDNLAAQGIYLHWGFRPAGVRVDQFGSETVESIRMVKSLEDFDSLYHLVHRPLVDRIYGEWEV